MVLIYSVPLESPTCMSKTFQPLLVFFFILDVCDTAMPYPAQSVRLPLLSKDLRNFPPLLGLPGSTGQVGLASTQCSSEAVT